MFRIVGITVVIAYNLFILLRPALAGQKGKH